MRKLAIVIALGPFIVACATTYQPTGFTGGFQERQLGPRSYLVRFQGNGYTSRDQVSDFILRRCAELTLEHDRRYFAIVGQQADSRTSGSGWMVFSFPHQEATMNILDSAEEGAIDAVLIVRQTEARAEGRLSSKARETLRELASGSSADRMQSHDRDPLQPGMKVVAANGSEFGAIYSIEGDSVHVRLIRGGEITLTRQQALDRVSDADRSPVAITAPAPDSSPASTGPPSTDTEVPIGTILYGSDGSVFGAIDLTDHDHVFDDGSRAPAVRVKVASGGYRWIRVAQALDMRKVPEPAR
jgi:hypothetical protein